ncbi:MAG TPA: glycosyltransferase [Terriglobia bacterium]|nr:glycosyltransferase [Terriglobia bacterium]
MRILISGHIYPDSFARNIAAAAKDMGHTVLTVDPRPIRRRLGYAGTILLDYLAKAIPPVETPGHRALVRSAERFEPDLVLIAHGTLDPMVVRQLRKVTTARLAAWYPDSLANLGRQYLLASDLDAWFFKDPYMVDMFRARLGLNAFYLPEACNPRWHRRVELSDSDRRHYGCDLTSACNMYYYRARILEMFANYNLKIWGSGFPFWLRSPLRAHYTNHYVAESEKSKAFNAAKIVVNTMYLAEVEGVNCRLFEAAGCGAFQIADWKPALPELFEPEREIVTFRSREELREKVDYYLARPEERQVIADRAYARAHREHTYENRLQRMFENLGLITAVSVPDNETGLAEGDPGRLPLIFN